MISQSPIYNLSVLLKETGIGADLVRAWERRYGLPMPQRSKGGHRLYSQHDIEAVKWLMARQEEGLSISRAVSLWRELLAAGRDPLIEYQAAALDKSPVTDTRIDVLRDRWLEACLSFDGIRAEEVLNHAFALYPVETVCTAMLQQGLHTIGQYWFEGKASVQQEHFATAQAVRRVEALILAAPLPSRDKTVLVGCPSGEWHTFPVLMNTLFLRWRGLRVVYLGANIPAEQMGETAEAVRPDLIVLSAQHLNSAASLQSTALQLKDWKLAYGGLIFNREPRLRGRIPAHFLGEDIPEALVRVEQLLVGASLELIRVERSLRFTETIRLFQERRAKIEGAVEAELTKNNWPTNFLTDANKFFGDGILSAMELGDLGYMLADMGWVHSLLSNRHVGKDRIMPYLNTYAQMIRDEMPAVGFPIADWIEVYVNQHQGME